MPSQTQIKQYLRKARRFFTPRRTKIILGLVAAFLIITPILTYAYFARDIADRERLMNRSDTGIVMRDKDGQIFYKFGKINGNDDVKLSQISDDFERAVIASEDQEFLKHEGFSVKGIFGAIAANVLNKDPSRYGGSTITQQLVKNKLLTADKNYLRKYQELILAIEIERRYTKQEILEMYVNSVYFGEGAFGIADASKVYFNKSPQDLTLAESSMLVGLLPAPGYYSPISGDSNLTKQQQANVLDRMVESRFITQQQRQQAEEQGYALNPSPLDTQKHAHHFALMVLDRLKKTYGEERITRSGFDVTTTLDLDWQKQAEAIIAERVSVFRAAGGRNATLVAIDPKTGQIRSLVGSADWNDPTFGKVNMALRERQPGSSFKPIFYAEAIEQKLITAASTIKDQPTVYGGNYRPTNYDFRYRGNVSTRTALALSLNVPAVEIMQKLGPEEASDAARRMGISTVDEPEKYGLTLGLGTAEVKPLELTNAYAAMANGGKQSPPTVVNSVKDKFGDEVYENKEPAEKRVLSEEASYIISSILADNRARAPTFGSALTIPGRQVAAKTGTTNDNRDAWTVGYTPSLAVGVWMGNNENQPMTGLAGASSAGTIWKRAMTEFTSTLPNETFQRPSGVVTQRVCVLDTTIEEVFIKGTEPRESCKINEQRKPEAKPKDEEKKQEKPETPDENQEQEPDTGQVNGVDTTIDGTGNRGSGNGRGNNN